MAADFRSFAEILRSAPPPAPPPAPAISPLIAEAPPVPRVREERLERARFEDRLESALEKLLTEIAAEVTARELLLAPADVHALVTRLLERHGFDERARVIEAAGDVTLVARDGHHIDASLGRRLRAAIDRALHRALQ